MKFAVCNEMLEGYSLEQQFALAAELGFDGIEIAPFTIAQYVTEIPQAKRQEIANLAERTGLEIAAIHWVLAKTEGFHVTHPDRAIRQRTIEYLCELVRFGVDIGARAMVVGSPLQRAVLDDVSYAEAWQWFSEAMAAAGQAGADADFKVCIEPLAPATDNNFILKTFEAVKMAREIGMPNVGVIIDTYSGTKTEEDLPGAIRHAADLLFHYHCNDINKRAPGFGRVDFVPIFRALLDIDFKGFCSIEVFDFSIDAREHAGKGLEHLRRCLDQARQQG